MKESKLRNISMLHDNSFIFNSSFFFNYLLVIISNTNLSVSFHSFRTDFCQITDTLIHILINNTFYGSSHNGFSMAMYGRKLLRFETPVNTFNAQLGLAPSQSFR